MNSPGRTGNALQLLSASAVVMLALIAVALWLLPPYNSEYRGDLPHHALMLSERLVPDCPSRYDAPYPKGSYLLSSLVLPFCDLDPYRAIRATSIGLVGALLCCQFFLIRRFVGWQKAVVILFAWQWLCFETKTGNQNFFYGAYFYSQATGTVAVWLALLLYCSPSSRWITMFLQRTVAALLVIYSCQCHLVPTLVGFSALLLLAGAELFRRRNWSALFELLAVMGVSAGTLYASRQLTYMNGCSTADGGLPIRNLPLLVLWVPTALAVAIAWARQTLLRKPTSLYDQREVPLYALLIASGVIQGYCFYRYAYCSTMAPYAVKKLFFYTFPAASLLWILWVQRLLAPQLGHWLSTASGRIDWFSRLKVVAALGLLGVALVQNYKECVVDELKFPRTSIDDSPAAIARYLWEERKAMPPAAYFDPQFPHASLYVTVAGLDQPLGSAYLCQKLAAKELSAGAFVSQCGIKELIVPARVPSKDLFERTVVGQSIGHGLVLYQLCDDIADSNESSSPSDRK